MSARIPNSATAVALRAAANALAQRDGYTVRAIPTVTAGGTVLLCTLRAEDGITFPHSYNAAQVCEALKASAK